jgi:hypothetical protein
MEGKAHICMTPVLSGIVLICLSIYFYGNHLFTYKMLYLYDI